MSVAAKVLSKQVVQTSLRKNAISILIFTFAGDALWRMARTHPCLSIYVEKN